MHIDTVANLGSRYTTVQISPKRALFALKAKSSTDVRSVGPCNRTALHERPSGSAIDQWYKYRFRYNEEYVPTVGTGKPAQFFSRRAIWRKTMHFHCQRPYCMEYTGSLPNSAVKLCKARIVLGWVTAREVLGVLLTFFRSRLICCFCKFLRYIEAISIPRLSLARLRSLIYIY